MDSPQPKAAKMPLKSPPPTKPKEKPAPVKLKIVKPVDPPKKIIFSKEKEKARKTLIKKAKKDQVTHIKPPILEKDIDLVVEAQIPPKKVRKAPVAPRLPVTQTQKVDIASEIAKKGIDLTQKTMLVKEEASESAVNKQPKKVVKKVAKPITKQAKKSKKENKEKETLYKDRKKRVKEAIEKEEHKGKIDTAG